MSSRSTIDGSSSPSVLLIRLDAIGDALALTPLLAAFRGAAIPVDIVLRKGNFDAFSAAAVRERFVAPFALRSSTRENRNAIAGFAGELHENAYTHTLVATEDAGGYELAKLVGSPHRIGFVNGWGKPLKTLWLRTMLTKTLYRSAGLDPNEPHECEVLFALGRGLVREEHPTRDPERLRPLVLDAPVLPDDRIVFQVTDKWERLGIDFDEVIAAMQLIAASGRIRAISAAAESDYADRIERAANISVDRFEDLSSWKSAIAEAAALVAPDSGAIHVAGMTGTPTVAVFAPISLFERQIARWAPWAAPFRIVKAAPGWPLRAMDSLRELVDAEQRIR